MLPDRLFDVGGFSATPLTRNDDDLILIQFSSRAAFPT
jgi:hypothetical protein